MSEATEDLERIEWREEDRTRRPTHPGEVLREEFLKPADISQAELARHIDCGNKTINRLVNEHTGVTPEMARKLASAFETTPEFWMNLQQSLDLYEARQDTTDLPGQIVKKDEGPRRPRA